LRGPVFCHYRPEDEAHGELTAMVRCAEFVGKSSARFNLSQPQAFEQSLGAFPIDAGGMQVLEGGVWHQGVIDQLHVRILIAPLGQKGLLGVSVYLATPTSTEDVAGTNGEISLRFPVTYGDLARVQSSLRDHVRGFAPQAVLEQSPS
jgi:hypothetical protein